MRYEDFSVNLESSVPELLDFCGLKMTESVKKFVASHTGTNIGGVSSTFRDSKTAPFMWRQKVEYKEVEGWQNSCEEAMNVWGYNKVTNPNELGTFITIGNYTVL